MFSAAVPVLEIDSVPLFSAQSFLLLLDPPLFSEQVLVLLQWFFPHAVYKFQADRYPLSVCANLFLLQQQE